MAERKKLNPENVSDALKYYTEHKYMDCYSLANNLKEQGYGWDDRDIGGFEAKNNKHYSMEQGMQKGDPLVGAYVVRNLLRGEKDFIDACTLCKIFQKRNGIAIVVLMMIVRNQPK